MLYLISIGIADENDMSLRALGIAKKCDRLYAEFYTTGIETSTAKLRELVGKEVVELKRQDMEEGAAKIISQAKSQDVGIFAGGDALSATTHCSLLLDAKKAGIETKVIHGSSIFSAVAETGLQLYKFGAVTSLVRPSGKYKPTSCYGVIAKNRKNGLHTLVLLDIGLTGRDGLEILSGMEKGKKTRIVSGKADIVVACRLGSKDKKILYGHAEDLLSEDALNRAPAVIVVPGPLHFLEKEFLESLKRC